MLLRDINVNVIAYYSHTQLHLYIHLGLQRQKNQALAGVEALRPLQRILVDYEISYQLRSNRSSSNLREGNGYSLSAQPCQPQDFPNLVYYEFEQAVQILAKALAYCDFPEDATSTIYRGPSCGQNNGAGDGTGRHEARRERGLYRWSRPLI